MRDLAKLFLLVPVFGMVAGQARGQQTPDSRVATGETAPALRPFDEAVGEILEMTGIPGAALAVAHDGRLVHNAQRILPMLLSAARAVEAWPRRDLFPVMR